MGKLTNMNRGNYTNVDAIERVIRYVTRTRINEDRAHELFSCGGAGIGVHLGAETMILQFQCVQNLYQIRNRNGRRMLHETFTLDNEEFEEINCDFDILDSLARECCQVYFSQGFQVVYGVHNPINKKKHIHFAVNTVNYKDGRKWHTTIEQDRIREQIFNDYLSRYKCQLHPISIEELYI